MAAFIPARRIYTQDVIDDEGNIDSERLLYVLNLFMEAVYNGFNRNLDFGLNINADIKTLFFNTSTSYTATQDFTPIVFPINKVGERVEGIMIANIVDTKDLTKIYTTPVTLTWVEDKEKLKITYITGLEDKKSYKITVLVI